MIVGEVDKLCLAPIVKHGWPKLRYSRNLLQPKRVWTVILRSKLNA